eukprot:2388591-Prorocentrum_lima.AAC.1
MARPGPISSSRCFSIRREGPKTYMCMRAAEGFHEYEKRSARIRWDPTGRTCRPPFPLKDFESL